MTKNSWYRHGALNTIEHAISRVSDAFVTLLVLRVLSPESFALLVSSQAWVSTLLFLLVAPETVLYRDFTKWQKVGKAHLSSRVRALRWFGWLKAFICLALAFGISKLDSSQQTARFWSLLYAFLLLVGPQIMGADREYLRLSLRLGPLNAINLYQKLSLLLGLILFDWLEFESLKTLGWLAVFSVGSASVFNMLAAEASLRAEIQTDTDLRVPYHKTIIEALHSFAFWNHLQGNVFNWFQTLDVLILDWARASIGLSSRGYGLYGTAIKLANLSLALPMALGNLFAIWLGRRTAEKDNVFERQTLKTRTIQLTLASILQYGGLIALTPSILGFISNGKYSPTDLAETTRLVQILGLSPVIACMGLLLYFWLTVRTSVYRLFISVSIPWSLMGGALIVASGFYFRDVTYVAWAKVIAMTGFPLFLGFRLKSILKNG